MLVITSNLPVATTYFSKNEFVLIKSIHNSMEFLKFDGCQSCVQKDKKLVGCKIKNSVVNEFLAIVGEE